MKKRLVDYQVVRNFWNKEWTDFLYHYGHKSARNEPGEKNGLLWFCEKCNNKLYEEYFTLNNIMTQFQVVFEKIYGSADLRTCKKCGTVMEPPVKK